MFAKTKLKAFRIFMTSLHIIARIFVCASIILFKVALRTGCNAFAIEFNMFAFEAFVSTGSIAPNAFGMAFRANRIGERRGRFPNEFMNRIAFDNCIAYAIGSFRGALNLVLLS
jgi:hypothetical protein